MPTGPGDVFDLVRSGRATTRGEILDATGLSRMTVAQRVDALLGEGLIVEGPTAAATGGRRPRRLEFNVEHSRVLTVTVDTQHSRIALTDLGGHILAEDEVQVAVASGPSTTLAATAEAAERLLKETDTDPSSVCGLGMSLPCPVDPATGRPSQPPMMPGWDGYPIAEHLQGSLPGVPVLTSNDADAAAVGEHAADFPTARALCLVKVDTGIGTGIVIDGRVYRGADGGSGDIGHARLREQPGEVCQCGAMDCLAALAGGRAVARKLTELGIPARSGHDVGELLAHGDPTAARLTQEAGRLIGEVMATVVCVLNPEVVVVGGALASAPLLAGIRESLYRLTLPRATRHLTLQLGSLGSEAAIVGLARLVVDDRFSVDAVNARFAAVAPTR
ncbi:sugar kinase [Nocardioides gansuensis]|uniref:Sugar kinase n=1 Tax=Nocardioides gansuensis TaxID=2138300 RepID=A0A2T8FDX3_9ACTN|nr:ROK family protein [Nocardioides gansuensis]PVG83914.1 sugar kinase [Nocardioides gansuensis]